MNISEENDLMELFDRQKLDAPGIKEIIDRTDRMIDSMIYELFSLTEEEIGIVEG